MSRPTSPARSLRLLALAAIAAATLLWLRDPSAGGLSGHARHTDCGVPIHAYVNDVDPRFGFDRHEVRRALDEAAALWQAHSDRRLFSEDARRRPMPVDLVYDSRQQRADAQASRQRELDARQRALDESRAGIERLRQEAEHDRDAYQRAEDAFNQAAAEHDRRVREWNAGTAARSSGSEARLRDEAEALMAERARLEQVRARLNSTIEELNRRSAEFDAEVRAFNDEVESFNRESGVAITAGGYSFGSREGRRIVIFKADSFEELVLVLAHELGHALGIDHVESPDAVMHAEVDAVALPVTELSPADARALARVCGS